MLLLPYKNQYSRFYLLKSIVKFIGFCAIKEALKLCWFFLTSFIFKVVNKKLYLLKILKNILVGTVPQILAKKQLIRTVETRNLVCTDKIKP